MCVVVAISLDFLVLSHNKRCDISTLIFLATVVTPTTVKQRTNREVHNLRHILLPTAPIIHRTRVFIRPTVHTHAVSAHLPRGVLLRNSGSVEGCVVKCVFSIHGDAEDPAQQGWQLVKVIGAAKSLAHHADASVVYVAWIGCGVRRILIAGTKWKVQLISVCYLLSVNQHKPAKVKRHT